MTNIPNNIEPMSLNRHLKNNRVDDLFYSHVSMIEPRGRFRFCRQNLDELYEHIHNEKHGVAEKPGKYSALYFDFDIKYLIENYKEHIYENGRFYDQDYLNDVINKINNILKPRIKNYRKEYLICCLLEKDIYKKNEKVVSGGFHLHYPNIFMETDIKLSLMKELKNVFGERFDDGLCHTPWLLYNGVKDRNLESYKLTKIFDIDLNEMTMIDTFQNYKIFDTNEDVIPINQENLLKLLPRIFSINPSNREICEFKKKTEPEPETEIEPKLKKEFPKNIDLDREKLEISLPFLKKYNHDNDTWKRVMFVVKSLYDDDEGYHIFDEWSQGADNYDDALNRIKWDACNITDANFGIIVNLLKKFNLYSELRNKLYKPKLKKFTIDEILFKSQKETADFIYTQVKDDCIYTTTHGWIIFNPEFGIWDNDFKDDFMVSYISELLCPIINEHCIEISLKLKELKEKISISDDVVTIATLKSEKKELSKLHKLINHQLTQCGTFSHINNVMKYLKSNCLKNKAFMQEFENKPELFAFADGTCIDIKSGNRRKIDKSDKLLQTVSYDYPERDERDVELVYKLYLDILGDENHVRDYLNFSCLSLYGNNNNELISFEIGGGRNGKGVSDSIHQQVFDVYYSILSNNILCKTEQEYNAGDNSELKSLEYKRHCTGSEPDKHSKLKTDTLKKLTGNDGISCKFMGKEKCQIKPRFTISILTNNLLEFSHRDTAIDDRVVVFNFPHHFVDFPCEPHEKQIDVNLKRNITLDKRYRNGLLHLLLDAYKKSQGIFFKSQTVKNSIKDYLIKQNPLMKWFESTFEINPDERGIPSTTLYEMYKSVRENESMSLTKFGAFIKELCPFRKHDDGTYYKCVKKQYVNQNNSNQNNANQINAVMNSQSDSMDDQNDS